MKKFVLMLMLLCVGAHATTAQEIDYKGFPQWSWHRQDSTEYYLYTPSNMKAGERYPIALFLHGCCGKSYKATLRNAVDPPARMWHNFGDNTQTVPTYIIAPATSRGWKQHIENLKKVMDDLVQHHQGDPQRIYITGFSMGGAGTVAFIEKYPDYFAAALPMGMDINADYDRIKHVPLWTNKGETDWFARNLNKAVATVRTLNGDAIDSSANHITGVNPRLTEFKGVGHNVQWIAASTQNLTGWAYARTNDGNQYPTVYFIKPAYKAAANAPASVEVQIQALDADGVIQKVEVYVNGKRTHILTSKPYTTTVRVEQGDSKIDAVAVDDKGKQATATTLVRVKVPATFNTTRLSPARQGDFYHAPLSASGNGAMVYALQKSTALPDGLTLLADGTLRGVPEKTGRYNISVEATDEDGDVASTTLRLQVVKKDPRAVVVTNARNYAGKKFAITRVAKGEAAHGDRGDKEITISHTGIYVGLALIQTDVNDTLTATPHYLEFTVDENVTVLVAYEKKDNLFTSTVPAWLSEFRKLEGPQIVTQYFYYDVYARDFPKGKITLPDAEEQTNGVSTNYFVMVKKR